MHRMKSAIGLLSLPYQQHTHDACVCVCALDFAYQKHQVGTLPKLLLPEIPGQFGKEVLVGIENPESRMMNRLTQTGSHTQTHTHTLHAHTCACLMLEERDR
mmetsp:Transcript_22724/g.34124  ORF Transcript_22724/g.34124 Transcript_22724/m.34124 type:complete len:102 (+) Transcript_22724:418-723(+)